MAEEAEILEWSVEMERQAPQCQKLGLRNYPLQQADTSLDYHLAP